MFKPRLGLLLALAAMSTLLLSVPSFADSQVRIVRLSDLAGQVLVDRNVGQGFEKALLNLPITQGARLQTRADGRAEVEFEDGGILHLAPNTFVEFSQLSLRDSGARVSTVKVLAGTAYLKFAGRNGDEFTLDFGGRQVELTQSAHLRLQMNPGQAALAVFDGAAQVQGPSGETEIGKKQTATFDLAADSNVVVAKKINDELFDQWDKEQDQYHDRYLSQKSNPSPYSYGVSDLNYYGSFMNVAGYGNCWQPYFSGAGWNPFMNGSWLWYPTGYTWVSSYPWGFMPYYYGSWNYVGGGTGWCWSPGSNWGMWNAVPMVVNAPRQFLPVRPPVTPTHAMVVVNRGPTNMIGARSNRAVLVQGSAGLGVPRGSFNNLNKLSQHVEQHGFVNATVRPAAINTGIAPRMASPRAGGWPASQVGRGASMGGNASSRSSSGRASPPPAMAPMESPAPSMSRGAGVGSSSPRR